MKIRRAVAADLAQLIALGDQVSSAAHWSQQQWLDIFHSQSPVRIAWIAEANPKDAERNCASGSPVGFLVAQCGPEWELENIVVAAAFRRCGIGRALLSVLVDEARTRQVERILLEVRVSNHDALDLYLKSGFEQLARRSDYYRDPQEDALILVHSLR
jgi:ribosomal-protein-alanine acetyltransferase